MSDNPTEAIESDGAELDRLVDSIDEWRYTFSDDMTDGELNAARIGLDQIESDALSLARVASTLRDLIGEIEQP